MAAAKALLSELPKDDAFKALDEVTSWLISITGTPEFRLELRISLTMLLDETGQPFHAESLKNYLASPRLQDFQGMRLWQGIRNFSEALAAAYEACLGAWQQKESKSYELREQLPLLCARLLRACAEQIKLDLMRYIDVKQPIWEQMFRCYSLSETSQAGETMVIAYPGHAIHTCPQYELLRALMLYVSSPGTLAPDQIEVDSRIAARMVSFFDFKAKPDPDSDYFIDLSRPGAPAPVDSSTAVTPSIRFFGAQRALPRIEEIVQQHERGAIGEERRFGSEFTPDGKLTVLKHLRMYWDKNHPHRLFERRGISALIEVAHGFQTISRLVTRIDLDQIAGLSDKDAAALKERSKISVVSEEEAVYVAETWSVLDLSLNGIGGMIPRTGGTWVKIGDLCGIKAQNAPAWWVGAIRRLHADPQGILHVGIEILAKKPLSVWLRVLGKGAERVSNWETSSGSFQYDYQPAILLPDMHNLYVNATVLLETGSYAPDNIYEVMLGEKSSEIKLIRLLAEGEDYELAAFQWLSAAHG
jgi:hypothetical protein